MTSEVTRKAVSKAAHGTENQSSPLDVRVGFAPGDAEQNALTPLHGGDSTWFWMDTMAERLVR